MVYRVVILTKMDDDKFRNVIESLSSSTASVSLGIQTTLFLYEKGVKSCRQLSQHYIHLLLNQNPVEVAEMISGFFEALKIAKHKGEHKKVWW